MIFKFYTVSTKICVAVSANSNVLGFAFLKGPLCITSQLVRLFVLLMHRLKAT